MSEQYEWQEIAAEFARSIFVQQFWLKPQRKLQINWELLEYQTLEFCSCVLSELDYLCTEGQSF